MKIAVSLLFCAISTASLAKTIKDEPQQPPVIAEAKPVCTPPNEMVVKLPFTQAITLNSILQDVDVSHRDWIEVATNVRAQLVGQCKETKKQP